MLVKQLFAVLKLNPDFMFLQLPVLQSQVGSLILTPVMSELLLAAPPVSRVREVSEGAAVMSLPVSCVFQT